MDERRKGREEENTKGREEERKRGGRGHGKCHKLNFWLIISYFCFNLVLCGGTHTEGKVTLSKNNCLHCPLSLHSEYYPL